MRHTLIQKRYGWCWTISTLTSWVPCTMPSKPAEARRIAKRLELHYTPVHGSWLNMAEIELSVFSNQCLNRRISDELVLKREVSALEHERQ